MSGAMVEHCIGYEGFLMALSPERDGAQPPEGVSRNPFCFSGDGVLWWVSLGKTRLAEQVETQRIVHAPTNKASSIAVLSTLAVRLYGRLRRKHRCCCDSLPPLLQPEGFVSALHSITNETGKPKVNGLYPPQVSGALIRRETCEGKTPEFTGGLHYSLEFKQQGN